MADASIPAAHAQTRVNPELTLRGLRVFVALEETGSVGGAAAQIGGSPSGVSQQITALEQAVGAKLFDRRSRPISLTPAGQILRLHAHRILDAVSEAQAELAERNLAVLPRLSLAVIDDLDATLTPTLVLILQDSFRHCFVETYSGRSDRATERLERREADIAISASLPAALKAYRALPLLRESLVLVAAKGLLNAKGDLRRQLAARPFVQYSEAMPIGRLVAQHLKRLKLEVERRYAFEASRSVFAMVAQAGGWTLATPLNLIDAERFLPGLEVFPSPFPTVSRSIYLIARDGELARLPERLAADCRCLLAAQVLPRFAALAPTMPEIIALAD
ncbi:MAG: LysR family transcriptional regulator [Rhodospirillales bacterium]|nr:LysR family transcriptional regulator [Rhodospirillales bacterium]